MTHGTKHAYSRLGCRCADCTEANRVAQEKRRRKLGVVTSAERLAIDFARNRHGTNNMYVKYGCRCEVCKEGSRVRRAHERAKARDRQESAR